MITLGVCKRCKYAWKPRGEKPKICPNCKSRYWNIKKKKLVCSSCGHKWIQKGKKKPKCCPNCCSGNWENNEVSDLKKMTKRIESFTKTGEWLD